MRKRLLHYVLRIVGIIFLILFILGFVLPYPKIPFLIAAMWCLEQSYPELHGWVLARFRKYLWRENLSLADKVRGIFFLIVPTLVGAIIAAEKKQGWVLVFEIAALAFGVGWSTLILASPTCPRSKNE